MMKTPIREMFLWDSIRSFFTQKKVEWNIEENWGTRSYNILIKGSYIFYLSYPDLSHIYTGCDKLIFSEKLLPKICFQDKN